MKWFLRGHGSTLPAFLRACLNKACDSEINIMTKSYHIDSGGGGHLERRGSRCDMARQTGISKGGGHFPGHH
jgi:hypothetical protein